jgi:hypothetical protein
VAEPSIDRACDAAIELFGERCWMMGGLMERVIGMDHLGGVVRRFYKSKSATWWRDDMHALRRRANADMIEILGELIDAARSTSSLADPAFRRRFDELAARERRHRAALLAGCDRLRTALDDVVLPGIGARRDPDLRLVQPPTTEGLARHAAAVALAFAVATTHCGESKAPTTPENTPPIEHIGISEFAAPPLVPEDAAVTPTASVVDSGTLEAGVDAGPADAGPALDAGKADAGKPKTKKDAGAPVPFIEHHGISEFAAPPLKDLE